jgi:2-methylcitrate dehydratase PrpD
MTYTEILTGIGLDAPANGITASAYAAAKKMVLDSLGCALAARTSPGVAAVVEQMHDWGGKPEATILLFGGKVPAPNAAFANGTLIHALDYDDIHIPAALHLMSCILPTALAAADMSGASGRDLLAATVMGVEIAGRLGIVERARRRHHGFLPSSLLGGFGAVVSAARLLGLSREQCVNAMGINYAQVSGNRQALLDMTLTKRLQPALAARSALWATALAARGVTGARLAFEGEDGYFKLYMNGQVPAPEELTRDHGWYQIERLVVKRYTSCGACHSAVLAAERLAREEHLEPANIDRVELYGCGPGGLVGGPFAIGTNPQVDAQFSVRYGVALALLRGPAKLAHFTDEQVRADTEVAELAKHISFVKTVEDLPPEIERPADYPDSYTKYHAVIVHTKDGRRLMRAQCPGQTFPPGADTLDSVAPKFMDCAEFSGACSPDQARTIIETVRALDRAPDLSALWRQLTPCVSAGLNPTCPSKSASPRHCVTESLPH